MTKRILAIVMAIVMCVSVMSVEVFASNNTAMNDIKVTSSGNTLSITWGAVSGAAKYIVEVCNASGVQVGGTTVTTTSATVTLSAAGTVTVNVTARNSANGIVGSGSATYTIAQSSTAGGITVTANSDNTVTASWTATKAPYRVSVNGSFYANTDSSSITISKAYSSITSIIVLDANNTTKTWTPTGTGTGSGSTGYVSYNSGKLTWTANSGFGYLNITVNGTVLTGYDALPVSSGCDVSSIVSQYSSSTIVFTVYYDYNKINRIGSYTYAPTGTGTGYGNLWLNGTVVSWFGVGSQGYNVTVYYNGYTRVNQNVGNVTSFDLSKYISAGDLKNYNMTITVTGLTTGYIGTAYYYYGNAGTTTTGGLKVTINGQNAVVTWDTVNGASSYKINYTIGKSSYEYELYQNSVSLTYVNGLTVTVQYKLNNAYYTIGTASVSSDGTITNNSGSNTGTGTGSGTVVGNVVTGTNCTLSIGTESSTLTWSAYSGAIKYDVFYTNNVTGVYRLISDVTGTSVNIPLGKSNCTSFTCQVVPYGIIANGSLGALTNGPFATVSYSGSATLGGSSSSSSEIKGITLSAASNGYTTVSWTAVSGATYYTVDYGRTDTGYTSINNITKATTFELPMGKNIGFEVYVYAVVNGRTQSVGYAIHKAGDSYTSTTTTPSTTTESETLSAYVTNFKGIATSSKVTLSWNAASGNPTYDVYWKRSSSSEWKKAKSTTKRALNISGLNVGVSYDFKVIANNKDSGVVTITLPKTGSTTVTAADPAGAGTSTTTVPEITSASGAKGTMEITWTKVKNATTYKVYIADQNSANPSRYYVIPSSSYWPGASVTINGTTAKITGMKAGTYKVRIKASTDNGKTWTSLADCDYRTVTVS